MTTRGCMPSKKRNAQVFRFFLHPFEVLAQVFAELLAAVFEVGPPPQPAGVTQALLGIDVPDRDQDARLLHTSEIGIRHRVEGPASWAKDSCKH